MLLPRAELSRTAEEALVAEPMACREDPNERQPCKGHLWDGPEKAPVLTVKLRGIPTDSRPGSYTLCSRTKEAPNFWTHPTEVTGPYHTWINLGSTQYPAEYRIGRKKDSYNGVQGNTIHTHHSNNLLKAKATRAGTSLSTPISTSSKAVMKGVEIGSCGGQARTFP